MSEREWCNEEEKVWITGKPRQYLLGYYSMLPRERNGWNGRWANSLPTLFEYLAEVKW